MAKGKKTGGRVKGTPNRGSLLVEDIAARFALDPFEILMMVAVGDWKGMGYDAKVRVTLTAKGEAIEEDNLPIQQRVQAAKEAVKYLHAQLQSVAVTSADEGFRVIVEDYTKPKE